MSADAVPTKIKLTARNNKKSLMGNNIVSGLGLGVSVFGSCK